MFIVDYRATERGIRERRAHQVIEQPKRMTWEESLLEKERLRVETAAREREDGLRLCRQRGMPEWALTILVEIADKHGVCPGAIANDIRQRLDQLVIKTRREIAYLMKAEKPGKELSLTVLGKWFGKDHTAISHMLACYQEEHADVPKLVSYDLAKNRLRNEQERLRMARKRREDKERRAARCVNGI
jgi:hypothetical protein